MTGKQLNNRRKVINSVSFNI